tara:strand:- start:509 stop:685 length:177 start_codon:yes stop_codon:yes gene_type:complete
MPKKKLTKAQVKRKLKQASTIMYDLFLDKLGHLKSDVPMSQAKILDVHRQITNAEKRM